MLCGGVSERQPGRAPRARLSLGLAGIAAAALTALAALAGFELALARAPAWRASLEQLVRARTGFAVQFQRLGVRWGWYGPEAVFHGVELADAQRSGLRMHAAQLIVRLDAWHSVQSGQLEAGRITLVGADIDLVRRGPAAARQAPAVAPFDSLAALRAVIAHWPNGRIDLQGGTLRLPAARASPLMLSVRRAMLQRSDDSWSAFADALLPQGLGRSVRIALTFGGAAARGAPARGASGTLRLDVRGAQLAGGRALLALAGECAPQACALLPQQGETDLNARLDWRAGVFSGASGEFEAQRLRLAAPVATDLALRAGHFALVRAREGWQLSLGRVRAQATVDGLRLAGDIPTLLADWSAARVRGARLQYVASVQALALGRPGDRLALEGLQARLAGTESALEVQPRRCAWMRSGVRSAARRAGRSPPIARCLRRGARSSRSRRRCAASPAPAARRSRSCACTRCSPMPASRACAHCSMSAPQACSARRPRGSNQARSGAPSCCGRRRSGHRPRRRACSPARFRCARACWPRRATRPGYGTSMGDWCGADRACGRCSRVPAVDPSSSAP